MSLLTAIRSRQRRSRRLLVAVLGIGWLNIALPLCAVGHGGDPAAMCADCPDAVDSDHGHRSADAARTGGQHPPCGHYMPGCATLGDVRFHQSRGDAPDPPPVAWITHCDYDFLHVSRLAQPPCGLDAFESSRFLGACPPLNVLFCVYLN